MSVGTQDQTKKASQRYWPGSASKDTCWGRHPGSRRHRLVSSLAAGLSARDWHVLLGARGGGTGDRAGGCGGTKWGVWQEHWT